MERITHNLTQGDTAWHAFRAEHFGASEASCVLGLSPYKTRDELLAEKKTGLTKEVDARTQAVFDKGHLVEKMALPIVEKMVETDLYPVTMSFGKLSASCDGLDIENVVAWENKQFNQAHYDQVLRGELPEIHWPQCQQVLYVTGAKKLFFTISDGTEEKTAGVWVLPDKNLQEKIIAGWAQFEKDLETFVPPQKTVKVEAEAVKSLPVPSIVAQGALVASNLNEVTPYFDNYLATVKTELATDQDFADGEVNAKHCRESAKSLKNVAKAVIGQIVEINDAVSVLEQYAAKFDAMGLRLEKAVKEQKEQIKANAILDAKRELQSHVQSLEKEIFPIKLNFPYPDYAGVIKGVRTIESMQSRINDAQAEGKILSDAMALDIREKLTWFKSFTGDWAFIFTDLQTIVFKPMDDFKLLVESRVKEAEEKASKAKQEAEAKPVDRVVEATKTILPPAVEQEFGKQFVDGLDDFPTPNDIINTIAGAYGVNPATARQYIINTYEFITKKAA